MACALLLAGHHPLWPRAALLGVGVWAVVAACRPRWWMAALPAGAALLNFSPWTGWLVCDEFDLLLLATLGGAYARRALQPPPTLAPLPRPLRALLLCMATAALLGLARGWQDAAASSPAGAAFDWFAGYTDAPNSWRVAKSELYALLLVPLWPRTPNSLRPLAAGLVAGLCVVVAAVLWERLAFTGLLNFDVPYRSVALFWEMHVGGEAIDGYLAMATPFAAWAVLRARRPWQWGAAAALAVLAVYVLLTTFSRGVYGAVLASLTLLCLLLLRQRSRLSGWRAGAGVVLALLLLAEVALIVFSGHFLWQRMAATHSDLNSRMQHWQRGLGTLKTPTDWLLGLGPGRLPAHYAAAGPAGEFSGAARWNRELQAGAPLHTFVTLRGPATRQTLGGQFALAQRVTQAPHGVHTVHLTLRVQRPTTLLVEWCERHLLFDGHCQSALLQVQPGPRPWQTLALTLQGDAPPSQTWHAPRPALFTLSVVNAAGAADIADVQLPDAQERNLLHNAGFAQGLAHWMATAQSYFLPWHIDNLLLELLIERGLLGVVLFGTLLAAALWRLTLGGARHAALAPYQAAALLAALCVGATGSLLDAPRVALVLYVLALQGVLCAPRQT